MSVEPGNADLVKRVGEVKAKRERGEPTVPSLMGEEKATNPFLRGDVSPEIRQNVGASEDDDAASTKAPSLISSVGHSISVLAANATDDEDDIDALVADIDEFEEVLEALKVDDLSPEECETFASETQKLGRKMSTSKGA